MDVVATAKQTRSRCDSPAPRSAHSTAGGQHKQKLNDTSTWLLPSPPYIAFIGAMTMLCGRASFLIDAQESLTEIAVGTFLTLGAAVMHFDFVEMAKEEAQKHGSQPSVSLRIGANGQRWLFFTSSSVLLLGILLASRAASNWIMPAVSSVLLGPLGLQPHSDAVAIAAAKRCAPLRASEAPHWRTTVNWSDEAAIFVVSAALVIGLAMSRMDLLDMSQQEQEDVGSICANLQGAASAEKPLKGTRARSHWRRDACKALLVVAASSAMPLLIQEM